MHKYFVLCQPSKHSETKTYLPVIAKDQKQAVKMARGVGLKPYGVIAGK